MVSHTQVAGNADVVPPPASSTPPLVLLPLWGPFITALELVTRCIRKGSCCPWTLRPRTEHQHASVLVDGLSHPYASPSCSGTSRSEVTSSQSGRGPGRQYKREITGSGQQANGAATAQSQLIPATHRCGISRAKPPDSKDRETEFVSKLVKARF